jgi:membrane carboxypeptidase/penicillin-binding protein
VAAPVWLAFMKKVIAKAPAATPFPIPAGIVFAKIDTRTGQLASPLSDRTRLECFKEGTEPHEVAAEDVSQQDLDFYQEEDLDASALQRTPQAPEEMEEDVD